MVHEKSVAELRAMVKSVRKEKAKAPSKMKKHELLEELGEDVEHVVIPVVKKKKAVAPPPAPAPAPVVAEVPAKKLRQLIDTNLVPKTIVPPARKLGKGVVTEASVAMARQETSKMPVMKMIAGSQEARDRMATIRAMRKSKLTSVE